LNDNGAAVKAEIRNRFLGFLDDPIGMKRGSASSNYFFSLTEVSARAGELQQEYALQSALGAPTERLENLRNLVETHKHMQDFKRSLIEQQLGHGSPAEIQGNLLSSRTAMIRAAARDNDVGARTIRHLLEDNLVRYSDLPAAARGQVSWSTWFRHYFL
jgi:hypothetical protein